MSKVKIVLTKAHYLEAKGITPPPAAFVGNYEIGDRINKDHMCVLGVPLFDETEEKGKRHKLMGLYDLGQIALEL